MANLTSMTSSPFASDALAWEGLQRAIMASSGFQRWCAETGHAPDEASNQSQEQLVIDYLRETLETLAY